MSKDKQLIESLGGAAKVAGQLGYSVQRVQNWKERGIPAQVKLDHPELFLTGSGQMNRRRTDPPTN